MKGNDLQPMKVVDITGENVGSYSNFIAEDAAENMGRKFYRGAVVCEGEDILAGMIWKLKNVEDDELDTESYIEWVSIPDKSGADSLFSHYDETMSSEGVVASYYEIPKDDKEMLEALKGRGFKTEDKEGDVLILKLEEFSELKIAKKDKVPPYIKGVDQLKKRMFTRGIIECLYHIHRSFTDDLAFLNMDWYDTEISCFEESDEKVSGFLLIHKTQTGKLRIDLLADWGPDARSSLLKMIRFSIRHALEKYPPETEVIIYRHDEPSRNLASYFFPGARGEECVSGQRRE